MKTVLEITAAENCGDSIRLTAQGKVQRAGWAPNISMTLHVAQTEANAKAFHVGRNISVSISPKASR